MKNYTEEQLAEIIIRTLVVNSVDATQDFTAVAGSDYGFVAAYELADDNGYAIQYGNSGQTNYIIAAHADDLAQWLEDQDLDTLEAAIEVANVRGIDTLADTGDTDAPCAVLIARHYYGPKSNTEFAVDHRFERLDFAGSDAAKAWIAAQDEETYYLGHNETGRPTYKIVAL